MDDCNVSIATIPKNLVQIHADETEVNRRVNCFVERKREEINVNNVQDFIEMPPANSVGVTSATEEEVSCARVYSSVFRNKDASSHLKGNF